MDEKRNSNPDTNEKPGDTKVETPSDRLAMSSAVVLGHHPLCAHETWHCTCADLRLW